MLIKPTRLYSDILNDLLSEFSYKTSLAGLHYSLASSSTGGLLITIAGYDDRLALLVQRILHTLKNPVIDPERLAVMKEKVGYDGCFITLG